MTVRAPAIEIFDSTLAVLQRGAELLADSLRTAIADRGRATLALSGGRTPVPMFGMLAAESLPWGRIQVFQVDERVAPRGHAERNSTAIEAAFAHTGVATHWMPVELEDLEAAARDYARELETAAGSPPVLDVVQLGLGADGHTASLFPASAALTARSPVAATESQLGRRRFTLTLDALNRARTIVWVVCGADKSAALAALVRGDPSIVAGRVRGSGATILADHEAAALLESQKGTFTFSKR
jgi:6-phosphogluconolactonase